MVTGGGIEVTAVTKDLVDVLCEEAGRNDLYSYYGCCKYLFRDMGLY